MAVRKTIVDVSRGVICKWRVVCGERGRGMESCFGWSVGDAGVMAAAVVSGGGCAWGGASEDADMMRGISGVRSSVIQSIYIKIFRFCSWEACRRQPSALRYLAEEAGSDTLPNPLYPSPFLI